MANFITAFLLSLCLVPFLKNPRRYASSGLAVLVHVALSVAVWQVFGRGVYLFALLGPLVVAYALGVYLFYSQHNFPDVEIREEARWTHAGAALEPGQAAASCRRPAPRRGAA